MVTRRRCAADPVFLVWLVWPEWRIKGPEAIEGIRSPSNAYH